MCIYKPVVWVQNIHAKWNDFIYHVVILLFQNSFKSNKLQTLVKECTHI